MAGIIEAHAGPPPLGGPGVQRDRLGALHVRIEAAQPEQARRLARSGSDRDPAHVIPFADLDKGRRCNGIFGSRHGSNPWTRSCLGPSVWSRSAHFVNTTTASSPLAEHHFALYVASGAEMPRNRRFSGAGSSGETAWPPDCARANREF